MSLGIRKAIDKQQSSLNISKVLLFSNRWVNVASAADALNRQFREEFVSRTGKNVATRGAPTMMFREEFASRTVRR